MGGEGRAVIAELNRLVELVEQGVAETTADPIDVGLLASRLGTTEYHLRRMFSSLAGMPLSEYVRRRRMTAAAADLLGPAAEPLLTIAVRHGYGSTEAFGRAFRSVHGASPADVRRDGGPLRQQPPLRFRLTIEGRDPMDTRLIDHPALRLVGHAARVPLLHEGVNPHIQEHIQAIPAEEHLRLKSLSSAEPRGLLQVTADVDPDAAEGTLLTYLHGVATAPGDTAPHDLDTIDVPAGTWAVFTAAGPYPSTLQTVWAATATDWFPSNPWRLRPGPTMVAFVERSDDFTTAVCELWMPVERA